MSGLMLPTASLASIAGVFGCLSSLRTGEAHRGLSSRAKRSEEARRLVQTTSVHRWYLPKDAWEGR